MIQTSTIELPVYQVGQLFLLPVLLLVAAMFAYSLYALGGFLLQTLQRRRRGPYLAGFPLLQHVKADAAASLHELDLLAHKLLDQLVWRRLASGESARWLRSCFLEPHKTTRFAFGVVKENS